MFDVRSQVGILFQEGGLFDSLTIAENVAYPLVNQHAAQATATAAPEEVDRARAASRCASSNWSRRSTNFPASSPAACAAASESRAPW